MAFSFALSRGHKKMPAKGIITKKKTGHRGQNIQVACACVAR